jgi:hypothetical protein
MLPQHASWLDILLRFPFPHTGIPRRRPPRAQQQEGRFCERGEEDGQCLGVVRESKYLGRHSAAAACGRALGGAFMVGGYCAFSAELSTHRPLRDAQAFPVFSSPASPFCILPGLGNGLSSHHSPTPPHDPGARQLRRCCALREVVTAERMGVTARETGSPWIILPRSDRSMKSTSQLTFVLVANNVRGQCAGRPARVDDDCSIGYLSHTDGTQSPTAARSW